MLNELEIGTARRFYEEVLNKGDLSILDEVFSPNYFDHGAPPDAPRGVEGFKQFFAMVSGVFPDVQVTVEDMVAAEGKVATRLTIRGTQKGSFMGFPATGKYVSWTGIDVMHLSAGKITERWSERNFFGMLLELGLISLPE